jgi:hypothetical protein
MKVRVRVMVFSATFNNISVISWLSDLLMEKARVPGENHDLSPIFKFINYNSCINKCNKYTLIMIYITKSSFTLFAEQGRRDRDHMVVEFTTTYAISTRTSQD